MVSKGTKIEVVYVMASRDAAQEGLLSCRMIDFVNPATGNRVVRKGEELLDAKSSARIAIIDNGVFRFVSADDDYADSFGFQWNKWHSVLSASRSKYRHAETLKKRSGLWDGNYETMGRTLLECGMGGGDDTEVLLDLPLAELHAFDISRAVDRASKYLTDPRITLSQASIYRIPYADESFDIVWCHRVIQHTPDPELAMRSVCRKVKPGGFLFVHSYKRSPTYMREFRYKYRWLTTRMPHSWIYRYVESFGECAHKLKVKMQQWGLTARLAYSYLPWYLAPRNGDMDEMSESEIIEWEKMVTFDALTPRYDQPMATELFTRILKEEGFDILWLYDPPTSPLCARAIKRI